MRLGPSHRRRLLPVWIVFVAIGTGASVRADDIWEEQDGARHAAWVLVQASACEGGPSRLYPDGYADDVMAPDSALSRYDIGRGLLATERALERSGVWSGRRSPDRLLAMAQSYRRLGEYDRALACMHTLTDTWPGVDVRAEALALAVLGGDSLQIAEQMLNTIGAPDVEPRAVEYELAYRWLLTHPCAETLDFMVRKVDAQGDPLPPRLRYWHAFAHESLGHHGAALYNLRRLLDDAPAAAGFTASEITRVVRAIPDLLLLLDRPDDALPLYRRLGAGGTGAVRSWGRYQEAQLLLAGGRVGEAERLLTALCADDTSDNLEVVPEADWRERACALAPVVARLASLMEQEARDDPADLP